MAKRIFDIIVSGIGLLAVSPLLAAIAAAIAIGSPGPVFYRPLRGGKNGKHFTMYKFRSMVVNADKIGGPSTSEDDPRLTKIGLWLRKFKLDELPQLINIFKGDMSFVGPRPEVVSELELYDPALRQKILSVRPGLTDLASIAGINEEEILKGAPDPHQAYREKIQPQKIKLQLEYIEKQSFWLDMRILVETFLRVVLHR